MWANFVMPGFSLTCGIVDVAFFGVLLPLIKDFFWIAISIPPSRRFLISLPLQLLADVYSTEDAKVNCGALRRRPHEESMSCQLTAIRKVKRAISIG
jgi:hypothetical protein